MRILITSIVDIKRVPHNRIHVLAEHLSRRHEVTILCLNAWWLEQDSARQVGVEYHEDGLFGELLKRAEVHYLTQRSDPPLLQQFTALPGLGSLLTRIELPTFDVHLNYCDLIAGHSVGTAAKRVGIPTLFDIADDLPHSFARSPRVPRPLRPVARWFAESRLQANIHLAEKVTFVTHALQDAYRLPRGKSALVPNGVHESFFASEPDPSVRGALGLEDSFVLGFVGTQLEWVDLETAFAALKTLGADGLDVRMVVVGGGEKLEANKRLASKHGVSDSVLFTSQVPLSEISSYISAMDVCLICRKETTDSHRSLPLKLFEYMACQKPVVSVPLAGVVEAAGDRVLYARDSHELADRIRQLHRDRHLRERMGLQGREFVRERYSWANICRRFEDLLMETSAEGGAT